jgi:hypothetical protein
MSIPSYHAAIAIAGCVFICDAAFDISFTCRIPSFFSTIKECMLQSDKLEITAVAGTIQNAIATAAFQTNGQ